jgi:endonuclease/exonuclease/phosphatase family metal-dependent hydrolase
MVGGAIGKPLVVFDKLQAWLTEKETIVAGDFNNSVVWDRPQKPTNFSLVNEWLERHGFVSAYHSFFKEGFGREKNATHYHLKSIDRPYHIDYVYTNRPDALTSVEIGSRADWIRHSDHVPVVLVRR